MTLLNTELIANALFWVMAASAGVQVLYYLIFYSGVFVINRKKQQENEKQPVSVIIAARNEADNLRRNLEAILRQDYPDFEVIVVDDASTDETQDLLSGFKEQYKHLHVTHVPHDPIYHVGKKLAVTIGAKAAQNELLLLTDADCEPVSEHWLQAMQENFTGKTEFVLGYGGYKRQAGILNRLIRFDAAFIAMQYLTFALRGIPYMGVGRNLAYKKSVFFDNAGFAGGLHLKSGDDDLFVNKLARKNNTAVEIRREAQIRSEPKTSFRAWRKQKQRHLETSGYYKLRDKILLTLEPLSRMVFYLAFLLLLFLPYNIFIVLGVFLTRFVIQQVVFVQWFYRVKEMELLIYSVLTDFLMPVIHGLFLLSNRFVKRYRWD